MVVHLAKGTVARWIHIDAILADVDRAGRALPKDTRASLALITDRANLRTKERLAALPFGGIERRLTAEGRGRRGT